MGGFDHIFDQWYTPEDDVYWRQAKMASSISHTLGTPADEAMVEHFAATGWRTGPAEMKAMMDWTTCRGLSRIVRRYSGSAGVGGSAPTCCTGRNPQAAYFRHYQNVANEGSVISGGRGTWRGRCVLDNAESAGRGSWRMFGGSLRPSARRTWTMTWCLSTGPSAIQRAAGWRAGGCRIRCARTMTSCSCTCRCCALARSCHVWRSSSRLAAP